MAKIRSINTFYNNHLFRSRLEARWAVFFDTIGTKWIYELEGFTLSNGKNYLPDFYLPDVYYRNKKKGVWIEIKPTENLVDNDLLERFSLEKGEPIFALVGKVHRGFGDDYHKQFAPEEVNGETICWKDEPMLICKCMGCGVVKIEFAEGNYMYCPQCKRKCDESHPKLILAEMSANSARFEWSK